MGRAELEELKKNSIKALRENKRKLVATPAIALLQRMGFQPAALLSGCQFSGGYPWMSEEEYESLMEWISSVEEEADISLLEKLLQALLRESLFYGHTSP